MNTGLDQYMDIFKDSVEDSAAKLTKSFEKKVPAHEIWAGIPAKKVKACAPGQAEEFAKHYSGYIKGWYLKEDK